MPRIDGIRRLTRDPAADDDPSAALDGRDHDEAGDDRLPGQGRREDWAIAAAQRLQAAGPAALVNRLRERSALATA
jgi:hypothetical protein